MSLNANIYQFLHLYKPHRPNYLMGDIAYVDTGGIKMQNYV